jgi:hypothetical protein
MKTIYKNGIINGEWKSTALELINHGKFYVKDLGEKAQHIQLVSNYDLNINFGSSEVVVAAPNNFTSYFLLKANKPLIINNANTQYVSANWPPTGMSALGDLPVLNIMYFTNKLETIYQ